MDTLRGGQARATKALSPQPTSLAQAWIGRPATWQREVLVNIALVVGFVIFVALFSRARFYLPGNPSPVSFQTFAVLLTGAILGSRLGLLSLVVYYLVGMAGLPVFQGGNNGWAYVSSSAAGGYLIGLIASAYVVGFLSERGWNRGLALWAMLIGTLVIYVPGLLWLGSKHMGTGPHDLIPWSKVFTLGMYPFLPGDLVKVLASALLLIVAWAYIRRIKPDVKLYVS